MKRVLSFLFLGFSSLLLAQSATDTKSWIGIKTDLELNRTIDLEFGLQHRSKDNFQEVDKIFLESSLDFRLSSRFSLEVGLRLIKNNDTTGAQQGYENKYRFHTDLNFKQDIANYTYKGRIRYQINNQFESQRAGAKTIRFKNSIEFNINQWLYDPEVLIEPFITVADPNFSGIRRWRYGLQTDIDIVEDQSLKVAYFYMTSTQYLERQHVIALFYKFDI